jgi:D-arabinose 1-dehydrogenase-like Zn-dependent alcohol dehydrogenase
VTTVHCDPRVISCVSSDFAACGITREEHTANIPDSSALDQAAQLFDAYKIACYWLAAMAQVQNGERVLFHWAFDVVDTLPLLICNHTDCEMVTTAGAENKQERSRSRCSM